MCEVLTPLKLHGARHAPGTVLFLTNEEFLALPIGTVLAEPPAPAPQLPKIPRTLAEKQQALAEAQLRVAKHALPGVVVVSPSPLSRTPDTTPAPAMTGETPTPAMPRGDRDE